MGNTFGFIKKTKYIREIFFPLDLREENEKFFIGE